jgi:extradiol dioxygenase family protein
MGRRRVLGCSEGRSSTTWCDFDFYGHQIVAHVVPNYNASRSANTVDGDPVPVPHVGAALKVDEFHELSARVSSAGVPFVINPHLRFKGQPGEQWTMFFYDPSGNALEFKALTNPDNLFAKYIVTE